MWEEADGAMVVCGCLVVWVRGGRGLKLLQFWTLVLYRVCAYVCRWWEVGFGGYGLGWGEILQGFCKGRVWGDSGFGFENVGLVLCFLQGGGGVGEW